MTAGGGNGNGRKNGDSAASRRADELQKELGFDLYAKYPRELIEFRMDRPPKDEAARAKWKPVFGIKTRVYYTYMRYSWCWPICMPYAVATDERDEILRSARPPHHPLLLSQDAVSDILGTAQQRVADAVLDLAADKFFRVEAPGGRKAGYGVFLEAKPFFTEEERSYRSTPVRTGLAGPNLEPAVARRFSSLLSELGDDEALIRVPSDDPHGPGQLLAVKDLRTLVWRRVLDTRTAYLSAWKPLRYSERTSYADTATWVRNLIDQRESSEGGHPSSSSGSSSVAAAGATTTNSDPDGPNVRPLPEAHGQVRDVPLADQPSVDPIAAAERAAAWIAGAAPAAQEPDGSSPDDPAVHQVRPAGSNGPNPNRPETVFHHALAEKFRRGGKPTPTERQSREAYQQLLALSLDPLKWLAWLTPAKLEPIKHAGAVPALIEDYRNEVSLARVSTAQAPPKDTRAAECAECRDSGLVGWPVVNVRPGLQEVKASLEEGWELCRCATGERIRALLKASQL